MGLLTRLRDVLIKPVAQPAIQALYRHCVAQARQPGFYADCGVPDTVDGRFDLLLLHVILVIRRLGDQHAAKQELFDLMYADMDVSLREMGVGDMGIAKKMKPMLAAFYGRAQAYEAALAAGDDVLATTLARNLYGRVAAAPQQAQALAGYVRQSIAMLEQQPPARIAAGYVSFPGLLSAAA